MRTLESRKFGCISTRESRMTLIVGSCKRLEGSAKVKLLLKRHPVVEKALRIGNINASVIYEVIADVINNLATLV